LIFDVLKGNAEKAPATPARPFFPEQCDPLLGADGARPIKGLLFSRSGSAALSDKGILPLWVGFGVLSFLGFGGFFFVFPLTLPPF